MPALGFVVLGLVLLVAGLAVGTVGVLGWRERLPRNKHFGVRTVPTMRDERTFRIANKVAGPPTAVAGAVGVVTGLLTAFTGNLALLLVGTAGLLAIMIAGGVLGHRAAQAVPEERPKRPAGCGGCACGGCGLAGSVGANVARMGGE